MDLNCGLRGLFWFKLWTNGCKENKSDSCFLRANQIPVFPLSWTWNLRVTSKLFSVPYFPVRSSRSIKCSPLGSHFVIGFKCIEGPWGQASGFKAVGKGRREKTPLVP